MIKVKFNNEIISLEQKQSLADILASYGYVESYFAVAINRCFIPRTVYAITFLQEGDVIEMISPMQGG